MKYFPSTSADDSQQNHVPLRGRSASFSDQPQPIPLSLILNPLRLGTRPYARISPLVHVRKESMSSIPSDLNCRVMVEPTTVVHEESTKEGIEILMDTTMNIEIEACYKPRRAQESPEGHLKSHKSYRSIPIGKSKIKHARHSRKHYVIGSLEQYWSMMAQPGKFSEARRRRRERHFAHSAVDFENLAV